MRPLEELPVIDFISNTFVKYTDLFNKKNHPPEELHGHESALVLLDVELVMIEKFRR